MSEAPSTAAPVGPLARRRLGRTDMVVTALGLGGVAIGGYHGPVPEEDAAGAVRRALELGIARHGSTLRDYARPDGSAGSMQHEFRVYGRDGEPCARCATPIEKTRVAGRGTWYCPRCQR